MKFSHLAAGAGFVGLCVLISGCGDVFRPVATPLPQPAPDPQNFRVAAVTSCQFDPATNLCMSNGATSMVTDVNVSGDTIDGIVPVGHSPVFALVSNNTFAVTVTTADFDNDTLTQHADVHAAGSAPAVSAAATIGLPGGAKPTSLITANGITYVAESGRNVVGVISGSPLALTTEIPVGANPRSLTVLPNGKKIYVVNQSDNSVSVISTADNSILTTIPVGSNPVFAVPSAGSTHVFVVNKGSNNVSVIDATSDMLVSTIAVGAAPNFAVTDTHNQRVIVTNSNSGSISLINADPTSPVFLGVTNVNVGTNPTSATALADGTRIYVANTGSNSVSVVNSLSFTVTKTIPVGTGPVSISSDDESSRVVTANRDSFNVSVINTSNDSEVIDATTGLPKRISAPQIDPACNPATTNCQKLNPIFVAVSPG